MVFLQTRAWRVQTQRTLKPQVTPSVRRVLPGGMNGARKGRFRSSSPTARSKSAFQSIPLRAAAERCLPNFLEIDGRAAECLGQVGADCRFVATQPCVVFFLPLLEILRLNDIFDRGLDEFLEAEQGAARPRRT